MAKRTLILILSLSLFLFLIFKFQKNLPNPTIDNAVPVQGAHERDGERPKPQSLEEASEHKVDQIDDSLKGYCPKGKTLANRDVVERSIREMKHKFDTRDISERKGGLDHNTTELMITTLQHSLRESNNYQDRLALASQYKVEGEQRLDLLDIPIPDSKQEFADSLRLLGCIQSQGDSRCSADAVDDIANRHAHNGLIWFRVAQLALQEQNYELAERYLAQAATAPVFESFWSESVINLQQSYQRWANASQLERDDIYLGYSSNVFSDDFASVFEYCRDNALSSAHTAALCTALGARMEAISNTYLELQIGTGLQRIVAEQLNDQELLQALEERKAYANSMLAQHGWLSNQLNSPFDFTVNYEVMYALFETGERGMLDYLKRLYEERIGPLPECE